MDKMLTQVGMQSQKTIYSRLFGQKEFVGKQGHLWYIALSCCLQVQAGSHGSILSVTCAKKHVMNTLNLPVCRANIVRADLLTPSHSHNHDPSQSRCLLLQQDLFAKREKVWGEQGVDFLLWTSESSTNSCENGYASRNPLLVPHILWQSMSLSVSKSIISKMSLYWVSRCYYNYYTHINPCSSKEISTDCQQKSIKATGSHQCWKRHMIYLHAEIFLTCHSATQSQAGY